MSFDGRLTGGVFRREPLPYGRARDMENCA
jgi:hypothetical protein